MPDSNSLFDILHSAPAERTAVILPEAGIQISYQGLRDQVMSLAEDLADLGIERGDRVATVMPSGLPAIVTFLAASIAGTAAPLNPGYRLDEFSFYLEDTSARLLLCPPDGAEEARKAAHGRVPVRTVQMDKSGFVRIQDASGNRKIAAQPSPDDVALVLHTSGSTGRPKRVPIRHSNLSASAHNIANTYALTPDDVALCVMPLFHVHGLVASVLSTFQSGGTVVVPAKFNSLSFWRIVRDTRASWYSAVPTIHHLLLSRAGEERPAGSENLRFIRSCSAALPPEMMLNMERVFGAPVLEAYGMTEAAHQMCSNPQPPRPRKPGSVGQGTGVNVSIMDAGGNHLPAGQRGEVVIQGPNVVKEYENNPEANAKSFTKGWFRTGDQGFLDEDGYLTLTGRIKELINRGGEKIAPREIDEVLLGHPAVAEAVAFGVPHPMWGEEVEAAVVLRSPEQESAILAYCKERLADFKRPKKLHIVEKIPRTATGKIQRGVVAATFAGEKKVKFLIAGAGAIGAYVGACMHRAGEDVTLFARGPHLRAMQANGVRVLSADGNFEARPKIVAKLEEAGPVDVIILGVKAHSLTQLAPQLKPLLSASTTVVSMENGIPWWYFQFGAGEFTGLRLERVDPGGVIAESIDPRRVVGSIVYLATEIVEPGVIRHIEGNRISLGEPDGSKSERIRRIAEALIKSGFKSPVTTRFRNEMWVKILGNVAFNPISALTRATIAQIARDPEMRVLLRNIMMESSAVANKLGVELPITIEQRIDGAEKVGEHKTSMLQDLEMGRPLELDAVVGAVLEIGERLGVPMPYTQTVYLCAKLLEKSQIKIR